MILILQEKFTLANGVAILKLGLGTWGISATEVVQAVKDAVHIGYRHIDTAAAVLWLRSPGTSFVIGHALVVDGGATV